MKKFLAILLASMLLVAMFAIPASAAEVNLVSGKGVTAENAEIHGSWNSTLAITNGTVPTDAWATGEWCGYKDANGDDDTATVYLVFDSFTATEITNASFSFGIDSGSGIGKPYEPWLDAYVDGEWKKVANFDDSASESITANGVYTYNLDLNDLRLPEGTTTTQVRVGWYCYGWTWVGEIAVYGEGASEDNTTTPSVPEGDIVNLVKGSGATLENATLNSNPLYADAAIMTDGNFPTEIWPAEGGQLGVKSTDSSKKVYLTLDAFDATTITGAKLNLGIDTASGIGKPTAPTLEALVDGNWVEIASFDVSAVPGWVEGGTDVGVYDATATVSGNVTATQVRLAWYSYGWNWFGEIEVYGVGEATEDNAPTTSTPSTSTPSTSTPSTGTPNTGDASSVVMFAVIALVAIAGSAVVIRKRG